jgi:DNA modification methylase
MVQKEIHELANLIPTMSDDEYRELVKDITANGLLEPIMLYEGKVLDGRHRYRACMEIGLLPEYEEYTGKDALQYVISKNVSRRHLNETQRSIVASRLANMERGGDRPSRSDSNFDSANLHVGNISQPEAAQMLNVSPRTVATVKAVEREAPELIPQMEAGKMSANEAYKEVKKKRKDFGKVETEIIAKKEECAVFPGDVWVLGKHKLVCGDFYAIGSGILENIEINACITDPPYGIDYIPDWKKWDGSKSDFSKIHGDDIKFNPEPFLSYETVVLFGAAYFSDVLPIGGWICWDKRLDEAKDNMIGSPFELAWFKSNATTRKSIMVRVLHGGVVNADSTYGNNEKRLHPTQKPVEMMRQVILEVTKPGDVVIDPFSGSGSTLLACERIDRKCIAFEIEPEYIKMTLSRWEVMTGTIPEKEKKW